MDSPRGRIHLMRGVDEGRIDLTTDVVRHLDLCLGCRACETACPSGVRYGELIESARTLVATQHRRGWRDRWRRQWIQSIFPHPQALRLLLLPLRVLEVAGGLRWLRRYSKWLAMLPRLGWWEPLPVMTEASAPQRHNVTLLTGCVQQVLFAETHRATVRVLARHGCAVQAPVQQTCCGALYLHGGDREQARVCARRNIEVLGGSDVDAIIVNAAGCGAMLKEYGHLLGDDPAYADRARAFSAKVRDATEYLAGLGLQVPRGRIEARVSYQDACHLAHGQGVREAPRQLLRQIPGLELVELPESDTCCGSAGSYNLTEPDLANRLGARKTATLISTGAECVAVANPGCAMQIAYQLKRAGSVMRVAHPIELLDQAYRDEDR